MIIDTHVHYDDEQYDRDREEILLDLKKNNIELVVNVGASLLSTKKTVELAQKYNFIYGAVGVHPNETEGLREEDMLWLNEISKQQKIVAIGEIGLDYYWNKPEREIQKRWFVRQLALAREVNLPVIIHSRDAAQDTLDIMKDEKAGDIGGVIHCFSYSLDMAKTYLDMGFYLGIGGVVTFKNAKKLKEVVEYMPLSRIVLETDCPYLAPEPNRGKRNISSYLPAVIREIAALKHLDYDEVEEASNFNAKQLYHIV